MNKWQQLGLAASTAIVSLGMFVGAESVQAASFLFDFDGEGQGSLSFENSPLTGVGEESISIDDLYNLAEDVSFQFSYIPKGYYPNYVYDDYGYAAGYNGETFNFLDGKLIGMNFSIYNYFEYQYYGGSRGGSGSGSPVLFVRNDRFTELDQHTESGGGFNDCGGTSYYDEETQEYYDNYVCYSDSYESSSSYEIQEEGISFQGSSLYRETIEYSDGRVIVNEDPYSYSGFTRFDELPQITFTTLEPITPSEPIPEPLTLLGTGTAMAFGFGFKKLKQKNSK